MHTQGWTFLHSLLNKYGHRLPPEEFRKMFLSDVPEEEQQRIMNVEVSTATPEIVLHFPEQLFQSVHYSWLVPVFEKLSPFFQNRILGLLPSNQQARIQEIKQIVPTIGNYIVPIKQMLLNVFFQKLDAERILPKEFLPPSPLARLLTLTKDELVMLIDLLSMHDLAEEMRQIVDNITIKAVYRCLKPHQHKHLYICLHQHEKVITPPLELAGWNGNCNTLQKKLHVRGMIRLAKALSGQHPDFIWYVTHALDTGRGKVLSEHIHEQPIPKVTPALQQQVTQTINYISKGDK